MNHSIALESVSAINTNVLDYDLVTKAKCDKLWLNALPIDMELLSTNQRRRLWRLVENEMVKIAND